MSTAPRYSPRYTVEDYCQWQGDWQLIDGVAVAMSPSPFGPHERVVAELVKLLGTQIDHQGCDCRVYAGLDWIVSESTVVRPDVMVVCGEQPDRHLERAPVIAVEVLSASTRELDPTVKKDLYRQHGVACYLIADPDAKSIETWNFAASEPLRNSRTVSGMVAIELPADCRLGLDLTQVFR